MHQPLILIVPVLMLLDYVLTIMGAKASVRVYRLHFRSPSYEMNPVWRKSVDQLRWFNPRHFIIVCVMTGVLIYIDRMPDVSRDFLPWMLGILFGVYGSVCGRHISNLLQFWWLNRNPAEVSGQVDMSHRLVLRISLFQQFGLIPVVGLIALFDPNPYAIGTLGGVILLALVHLIWIFRARFQSSKSGEVRGGG